MISNVSFDNFTHIEYTFENDEALVIIIYLLYWTVLYTFITHSKTKKQTLNTILISI